MTSILLSLFFTAFIQITPDCNNQVKFDSLVYNHQKNRDLEMDFLDAYKLAIGKALYSVVIQPS